MIEIRAKTSAPPTPGLTLTLPFQDRQRSRLRVLLSHGREALMMMPRGTVLRGGDAVALSDGQVALVVAAPEPVSTVRADDARSLARAAYHLGNRHIPLEVGDGFVRYLHDHVLDAMVRELGLVVREELAGFEPEGGAYGKAGHSHGHSHSHAAGGGHATDDHAHHHHDHDHDHAGVGRDSAPPPILKRAVDLVSLDASKPESEHGH